MILKLVTNFSLNMIKRIFILLLLFLILFPSQIVTAQDNQPGGPVYVVQSGDTFYLIAIKFGVTVDQVISANPNIDPNMLSVGMEVVVPGLEGVRGKLMTQTIPLGETMRSLSIRNQVTRDQISKLNRITSPAEVLLAPA